MAVKTSKSTTTGGRPEKSGAGKSAPRRGRVSKLSRTASGLVSKAIRAKGFAEAEVVTRWGQIVGPELARATVPVRLQFPRGERHSATLHVRTESAFAPVLQQRSAHIIELVNRYLGYAAVIRIEVKQGPLTRVATRQPIEKQTLNAGDREKLDSLVGGGELSPLRSAVKSLGEYVLSAKDRSD